MAFSCNFPHFFDVRIEDCNTILVSKKGKSIAVVVFILYLIGISIFFIGIQLRQNTIFMGGVDGVERQDNGDTLVNVGSFVSAVLGNTPAIRENTNLSDIEFYHEILMLDESGAIIWRFDDIPLDHVVRLRDGIIFAANSDNDSIVGISYPAGEIVWQYNFRYLNFTEINPAWDADHYYNNPNAAKDWTHINDIDFKKYSTWNACLIDIRNFNLILEINFTAAFEKTIPDPSDVIWWHTEGLARQHNPDYLPNGNIIVSNSDAKDFLEINYTTHDIEMNWTHETIDWARDINLLPNGHYLITDIDEVIEVDIDSNIIIKRWVSNTFGLYTADYLENGNVLVSGGMNGRVFEVSPEGNIVWQYGSNAVINMAVLFGSFLILIEIYLIFVLMTNKATSLKVMRYALPFLSFLIVCHILTFVWADEIFMQMFLHFKF